MTLIFVANVLASSVMVIPITQEIMVQVKPLPSILFQFFMGKSQINSSLVQATNLALLSIIYRPIRALSSLNTPAHMAVLIAIKATAKTQLSWQIITVSACIANATTVNTPTALSKGERMTPFFTLIWHIYLLTAYLAMRFYSNYH